jgi:DNA-directed RNA polymerase I, II, and III subunit RPABC5
MTIPVKCFTCGNALANKYSAYKEEVKRRKISNGESTDKIVYLTYSHTEKSVEGQVLDELKLTKMCCRSIMLTNVDINL